MKRPIGEVLVRAYLDSMGGEVGGFAYDAREKRLADDIDRQLQIAHRRGGTRSGGRQSARWRG